MKGYGLKYILRAKTGKVPVNDKAKNNQKLICQELVWSKVNGNGTAVLKIIMHVHVFSGLGTVFFYVLNASFFCVLLKHATFFCILFSSFWRLMRPKRTMRSFVFFS